MKDLVAAINRLADAAEAIVAVISAPPPPEPTECGRCNGLGQFAPGVPCAQCEGTGRL